MQAEEAQAAQMTAVSLIDGGKADNSEILSKENNAWSIWVEE